MAKGEPKYRDLKKAQRESATSKEKAEKAKRALPGVAGDDFRGWFRVLAEHGWKGRMSIEANGGGEVTAYAKAVNYLQNQAKEAGI